jgi:hypothetical protein
MNRVTGEVLLNSVSGISVGTILNMKLANKLTITSVKKPMYGQSYFVCAHYTDGGEFNHISNYVSTNFPGKYPEIFVYDAKTVKEVVDGEAVYFNDDAYYHFRSCVRNSSGYIKFTVDDLINSSVEEPRYNDFVDLDPDTEIPIPVGRLHIPWPTHKYLLLKFADGTLYKCYLDSPIDSLFATGDIVEKYQVLGRCVNVANNNVFEDWNEFSGFSRSNGIDKESNMLELVYSIPFAKYGVYFPN